MPRSADSVMAHTLGTGRKDTLHSTGGSGVVRSCQVEMTQTTRTPAEKLQWFKKGKRTMDEAVGVPGAAVGLPHPRASPACLPLNASSDTLPRSRFQNKVPRKAVVKKVAGPCSSAHSTTPRCAGLSAPRAAYKKNNQKAEPEPPGNMAASAIPASPEAAQMGQELNHTIREAGEAAMSHLWKLAFRNNLSQWPPHRHHAGRYGLSGGDVGELSCSAAMSHFTYWGRSRGRHQSIAPGLAHPSDYRAWLSLSGGAKSLRGLPFVLAHRFVPRLLRPWWCELPGRPMSPRDQ